MEPAKRSVECRNRRCTYLQPWNQKRNNGDWTKPIIIFTLYWVKSSAWRNPKQILNRSSSGTNELLQALKRAPHVHAITFRMELKCMAQSKIKHFQHFRVSSCRARWAEFNGIFSPRLIYFKAIYKEKTKKTRTRGIIANFWVLTASTVHIQ